MNKKKASLELSVNAIVILIIAITMLGLGLAFIKMLFGGATDKLAAIVEEEQEPNAPSAADPISLSRTVVLTSPGKDVGMKVSLYNPTNAQWADVMPVITCSNPSITITSNKKTIAQGAYATFGILIKVPSSVGETTELCELKFRQGVNDLQYAKDFTIKVENK